MNSIITTIAARTIANKTLHVDGNSNGLSFLHLALKELEQRINNTASEKIRSEAALMARAVGDVIKLAYSDFQAFAMQWECSVHFWNHPEQSNNFTFFFKEKNDCPKSYQFRFSGLRGALA